MRYRIAFVGAGSIGRRHIRNVSAFLRSRGDDVAIDLYRSDMTRELPPEVTSYVDCQYPVSEPLPGDRSYDAVFVTNPTSLHYETVVKFLPAAKAFFIEKPVFDSAQKDMSAFSAYPDTVFYVACPLRYCKVLQYVAKNIDYRKAISVRAISSSYLPDWRPGQDYRDCYSAHRDMGGGVAIDLIHEWDYLTNFFGMPGKCFTIQDKISGLEIDSDDIAVYIAKAGNTAIELHLDYFGRKTLRTLELYMPDETIVCNIEDGRIDFLKSGESVILEEDRDEYQMAEIEHFFDIIEHRAEDDSDLDHAVAVLKLTKGEI